MAVFKCKMCGGDLEVLKGESIGTCSYCGSTMTLPKLGDEKRANLYDRANHYRRNNEFDKAMALYENILNEDKTDAEAYWSLVLCKYGIEYVEDPRSHKRVPTCNRTQYTSILADEDYKKALEYADSSAKRLYEEEAKVIDGIQKGILEISSKEDPFDIFICYKETDNNGRRTPDSVLAQEIYFQLNNEGYKVFFSRITLESVLGTAYEPYIFAALNSAKVMIVVGTKPEYFNSPWVKNEWSRFLGLIKSGSKKTLIPAYKDMDPYDLPEEFSHLQSQDMSKLGFISDLSRGIKKILDTKAPKETKVDIIQVQSEKNVEALLKRAFLMLEDSNFSKADELLEQVLNLNPELPQAYLGKLMVEFNVKNQSELKNIMKHIGQSMNFQKFLRFSSSKDKEEMINLSNEIENNIIESEIQKILAENVIEFDASKTLEENIELYIGRLNSKYPEYRIDRKLLHSFSSMENYQESFNHHFEDIKKIKIKNRKKIIILLLVFIFISLAIGAIIFESKYNTYIEYKKMVESGTVSNCDTNLVDFQDINVLHSKCVYLKAYNQFALGNYVEAKTILSEEHGNSESIELLDAMETIMLVQNYSQFENVWGYELSFIRNDRVERLYSELSNIQIKYADVDFEELLLNQLFLPEIMRNDVWHTGDKKYYIEVDRVKGFKTNLPIKENDYSAITYSISKSEFENLQNGDGVIVYKYYKSDYNGYRQSYNYYYSILDKDTIEFYGKDNALTYTFHRN